MMKTKALVLSAVSLSFFLITMSQHKPYGTYKLSCPYISYNPKTKLLFALCSGCPTGTCTNNISAELDDVLENINGHLSKVEFKQPVPISSYLDSCKDIVYQPELGGLLSAHCLDSGGTWQDAKLAGVQLSDNIIYNNGKLEKVTSTQ